MSGNNYYYYSPGTSSSYPEQQQQWQNWTHEQQQYAQTYARTMPPFHTPPPPLNHINHIPAPRPHGYQQTNQRHYAPRGRYNNVNQFNASPQQSWQRMSNNYKRPRLDSGEMSEPKSKSSKKKKKPLSQNVPSKKDWTLQDAEKALAMEKDYNKRNKNHSLIIKFPDLELSKDIVSKFHPDIENVHFQQPSTARFCFVTLQESANPDVVISQLNKLPFGDGLLTAEYKKDREEDQNLGPEDIDPLTLYVGNLAQEITKEDMVKTYPKSRRIDIGYAKKMKYTRYAFVTFKNILDSLEAFKQTHSTQMYSKSLIVRFRRLHGTVGMPGESKPQNPPKKNDDVVNDISDLRAQHSTDLTIDDDDDNIASSAKVDVVVELDSVKNEPNSDDEFEQKPSVDSDWVSPFLPGSVDLAFTQHRPKIKYEVKEEVKVKEDTKFDEYKNNCKVMNSKDVKVEKTNSVEIKQEPGSENDDDNYSQSFQEWFEDESDDADDINNVQTDLDLDTLYSNLVDHAQMIKTLKKAGP